MMEMKTWKHKTRLRPIPAGPWDDEPDKAHWVDPETDLDCLIHRNPLGALCGYVAVPPGHPYYEKDYDDVDVEVHGGLTYADKCREGADPSEGICHVPLPGRPEDVWWLGFDCAHLWDLTPGMEDLGVTLPDETYRDFEYVKAEIEQLAKQLAGVAA
jgi:hypothetical protein